MKDLTKPDYETIYSALNQLMKACNLSGESGTEELLEILSTAVQNVDWKIIDESHHEGLCYDANCLLTEEIITAITERKDEDLERN